MSVVRALIASASLLALGAGAAPAFAQASKQKRVDVTPYLGVDQVVLVPLKGDGDVLTYTNLTAGVTVEVQTRQVNAAADVQYTHSFGWSSALDSDVLSGIAHAGVKVARGLSIEAGGVASRVRTDGFSGAATINDSYTSQVWAGSIGPSYTTRIGDLDVRASYRLGYARVDDDVELNVPGAVGNGSFSDSWSHSLNGSVGFAPGTLLPVGLTASAGYDREDASQLDQRFEDGWGKINATLPVSRTVALIGSLGYEHIEISQRPPLRDEDGVPLVENGRYVTDKSAPRELYYDSDGLIWDAGVLWRPSRRMTLQATVGQRYGGMTYQGSFLWQGRNSSVALVLFDSIDSFGRMITGDAAALAGGGGLIVPRNPFTGDITGCAFSTVGGGQCFNDALTGITGANFRYRGVAGQYSSRRGPWGWGLGAGYSQRKFITPEGQAVLVRGTKDQNWYGNGTLTYAFNDRDSLDTTVYVNYFDASNGRADVLNYGAFSSYFKGLTRRLTASASVGVDAAKADDFDTLINAMGQVGLRYSF